MHTGFYEELDHLREEDEDADFGFLENIEDDIYDRYDHLLTAYDYLHGYCAEFTRLLHEKYGYPAYMIKDEEGRCIHCFCMCEVNGKNLFIDVRGITDNCAEFLAEFEDWTDIESSIENTVLFDTTKEHKKPELCITAFANQLLEDCHSYYTNTYIEEYFNESARFHSMVSEQSNDEMELE